MSIDAESRFGLYLARVIREEKVRTGVWPDDSDETADRISNLALDLVREHEPELIDAITLAAIEGLVIGVLDESVAAGESVKYVDASGKTVYRATRHGREMAKQRSAGS